MKINILGHMAIKFVFVSFLMSSTCFIRAQNNSTPEQAVLDYFVKEILPIYFNNLNKVYYTGQTDSSQTAFYVSCFATDTNFSNRDTIKILAVTEEPTLDNSFKLLNSVPVKQIRNENLIIAYKKLPKWKVRKSGFLQIYSCRKIRNKNYISGILYCTKPQKTIRLNFELDLVNNVMYWCMD